MNKLLELLKNDIFEWKLFHNIEMPLVPILAEIEYIGFAFMNEICQAFYIFNYFYNNFFFIREIKNILKCKFLH